MPRGRPKGSRNKKTVEKQNGAAPPAAEPQKPAGFGHNLPSDDQLQALTRKYAAERTESMRLEKKYKADRMNLDKKIKADLGAKGLADIKLLEQLSTPEGEKEFQDEMERQARVARWSGLQIGTQGSLFDEDRRPVEERAFDDGKRSGLAGDALRNPHAPASPGYEPYNNGWRAGQDALFAIKRKPDEPPAELLRGEAHQEPGQPDEFDNVESGPPSIGQSIVSAMEAAGVSADEVDVSGLDREVQGAVLDTNEPLGEVEEVPTGQEKPWPDDAQVGSIN